MKNFFMTQNELLAVMTLALNGASAIKDSDDSKVTLAYNDFEMELDKRQFNKCFEVAKGLNAKALESLERQIALEERKRKSRKR